MKVTIELSDTEDGMVAQTVNYGEAFDPTSNAHVYANIMIGLAMDAQKAEPQPEKPVFDLSHLAAGGPVSELPR